MQKDFETLNFTIDDKGVAELTLNRPQLHNAFNDKMIAELTILFTEQTNNKDIRLLMIKGDGKSFCAGADLNWMKSMKGYSEEDNFQDAKKLAVMLNAINEFPHPLLAVVHGNVLGGGVGLISACDYVLAHEATRFGLTEVRLGLLPAVISPFVIAKIGESMARAYMISGKFFSATEALKMNLVHEVAPTPEELQSQVSKIVQTFLKTGPYASREAKVLVKKVLQYQYSKGLRNDLLQKYTCSAIGQIRIGDEAQEGMKALLEKRPPKWQQELS